MEPIILTPEQNYKFKPFKAAVEALALDKFEDKEKAQEAFNDLSQKFDQELIALLREKKILLEDNSFTDTEIVVCHPDQEVEDAWEEYREYLEDANSLHSTTTAEDAVEANKKLSTKLWEKGELVFLQKNVHDCMWVSKFKADKYKEQGYVEVPCLRGPFEDDMD